jgi:hypothetical protein
MSPTTDDLRQVLAHASATTPPVGDLADVAARRGRTIRRRRTAAVVAVAALAVGAIAVPNLAGRTTSAPPVGQPTPTPTASTPDDQPLPEYLRGGHLVASAQETNWQGVTLTYTPGAAEFGFVESCSVPGDARSAQGDQLMGQVRIDGRVVTGTSCSNFLTLGGDGDFTQPHDYGVTPGTPVTLTLGPAKGQADEFGVTTWRLAVYEAVPLDEYPFPDRPDQLLPIDQGAVSGGGPRLVWGDGSADQEGFTYTVPVEGGLEVRVATVEPGEWRMLVNGVVMVTDRSWTYEQEGFGANLTLDQLGIRPGDEVELSFQTDRFTGNTYTFAVYDYALPTPR